MAGNRIEVKITGLNSLRDKLRALVPRVRNEVRQRVAEALLLIETDAKLFAPVDTGRLRSSIHAETASDGLSGTVGTNVEYADHVEFGTSRQRAQPFLFPAYEKNRAALLANLKNIKLF